MMNKDAIMEKLGEAKEEAMTAAKNELGFMIKGAFVGVFVAYSVKCAAVAYDTAKDLVKENL